ncbi:MAG TPA: hypothetical protein VM864_13235 [Pyrinomonadaceae bacterium]|jgi:hypothetical protein|nr:hypothetical protein [Pyrinomonadaceae bacterium]
MKTLSEEAALALLRRGKAAFQSHIKTTYERAARPCAECPTPGACCTDAHFVNVHITRLEAVAIRETLSRTPRLDAAARSRVYERARAAVERYGLSAAGDTFARTYSCPLFAPGAGCLVHARAKPAPCAQHACYDDWRDVPPLELQWRAEARVERLNEQVYGAAWEWLPVPVWLALVDPASDGAELSRLTHLWESRRHTRTRNPARLPPRRSLPVVAF